MVVGLLVGERIRTSAAFDSEVSVSCLALSSACVSVFVRARLFVLQQLRVTSLRAESTLFGKTQ